MGAVDGFKKYLKEERRLEIAVREAETLDEIRYQVNLWMRHTCEENIIVELSKFLSTNCADYLLSAYAWAHPE